MKWKLVPAEPTDAMLEKGRQAAQAKHGAPWDDPSHLADIFHAMLEAAPEPDEKLFEQAARAIQPNAFDIASINEEAFVELIEEARAMARDAVKVLL